MSKYFVNVGRVRVTSDDAQKLREILKRDRDRKAQAARERQERAIQREVRNFRHRYRDVPFRYGNVVGLLCTFRPRDQQIIARWWLDEEFIPPKTISFIS